MKYCYHVILTLLVNTSLFCAEQQHDLIPHNIKIERLIAKKQEVEKFLQSYLWKNINLNQKPIDHLYQLNIDSIKTSFDRLEKIMKDVIEPLFLENKTNQLPDKYICKEYYELLDLAFDQLQQNIQWKIDYEHLQIANDSQEAHENVLYAAHMVEYDQRIARERKAEEKKFLN